MPTMTNAEAYEVLGLTKSATETEVKSAYKKLALRTHPDKNPYDPDASKKFHRISEAYKRIIDPSSFHDDDDDEEDATEEEMASMFNMMFSEMFGGGDVGAMFDFFGDDDDDDMDGRQEELNMIRAMEMMMNHGINEDDDDYDDDDADDVSDENDDDLHKFMANSFAMNGSGLSVEAMMNAIGMSTGGRPGIDQSDYEDEDNDNRMVGDDEFDEDDEGLDMNDLVKMMMGMTQGMSSAPKKNKEHSTHPSKSSQSNVAVKAEGQATSKKGIKNSIAQSFHFISLEIHNVFVILRF